MEYRKLGKWGVRVSNIGLGSFLTIGHHVPDESSRAIVYKAYEAGINLFDTANSYNSGNAEIVLGRLLADFPRRSYVLATKVFGPMGEGPNDRGLSRKHIFEECHASLTRLKSDYIDLYQCHRYDPEVPIEEVVEAMDDLTRQGKILYWGVSEWSAAQTIEADDLCIRWGLHRPISNQPRYSLLWRYPEHDVFPLGQTRGIGQIIFSPLAHGVLTGKYKPGEEPPSGTRGADPSQNQIMMSLYSGEERLRRVQRMTEMAQQLGASTAQLAIAWILRNPVVSSAIAGVTRIGQLNEILGAFTVKIPDETMAQLDQLFPAPPMCRAP
jgi:voltage-dependent potassium channel beta subunit